MPIGIGACIDAGANGVHAERRANVVIERDICRRKADLTAPSVAMGDPALDLVRVAQKPRTGGRLPTRTYRAILSGAKIMPSPFGWGELGVRDYETFIFGAALVKPDMAHTETWPNLFVRGQT